MAPPRRDPERPEHALVTVRELQGEAAMARSLRRVAHSIVERNGGVGDLVLVGVRTGGVPLAERLARLIAEVEGTAPALGAVDITLYRDDVFEGLPKPEIGRTELPLSLAGCKVVLVDDVLYTGRTVRAALDVLMDYGRPRAVELAVLVDRGHRELPIQPDYVGLRIETTRDQSVQVELDELDGADRVLLRQRPTTTP